VRSEPEVDENSVEWVQGAVMDYITSCEDLEGEFGTTKPSELKIEHLPGGSTNYW
jgi:prenyltransferase beta subunit